MNDRSTVLVLGGGTGGIVAAGLLRESLPPPHRIVLIDRTLSFHLGTTKTWVMAGIEEPARVTRPLDALGERGVELVRAEIERIDVASRTVRTTEGTYESDYLVIALGAHLNMGAVLGLADAAETFYTMEGAVRLREALGRFGGGEVVVLVPKLPFMCPPGPYEGALLMQALFAERGLAGKTRLAIRTVETLPMATAGAEAGRFIVAQLERRGIAFHPKTSVASVDGARKKIVNADGSEVAFDLLVAIPPHEAPRVVRESGLAGPAGWIPVAPDTLEIANSPAPGRIYAIGDVASVPLPGRFQPEAPLVLPKAGTFAEGEARVVASRIASHVRGRTPDGAFGGEGFCYIEIDRGLAARGDGRFFEMPNPKMAFTGPDEEMVADKRAWVEEWMEKYL